MSQKSFYLTRYGVNATNQGGRRMSIQLVQVLKPNDASHIFQSVNCVTEHFSKFRPLCGWSNIEHLERVSAMNLWSFSTKIDFRKKWHKQASTQPYLAPILNQAYTAAIRAPWFNWKQMFCFLFKTMSQACRITIRWYI